MATIRMTRAARRTLTARWFTVSSGRVVTGRATVARCSQSGSRSDVDGRDELGDRATVLEADDDVARSLLGALEAAGEVPDQRLESRQLLGLLLLLLLEQQPQREADAETTTDAGHTVDGRVGDDGRGIGRGDLLRRRARARDGDEAGAAD